MKLPPRIIVTRERSPNGDAMMLKSIFFPRILPFQNEPQGRHDGEIGDEVAQREAVAEIVRRGRLGAVELCAQHGA